jgi:midasin (ATPase involved in ribosome maturation)
LKKTESSEKNHRKLMKLLRDYDEVLDSSVMSILEQNFVEGIRSTNQAQAGDHEPITAIPGNASMFPDLTPAEIDVSLITPRAKANSTMFLIEVLNDDWASTGLLSCTDKYITGIGHYYRRMESVISRNVSWANAGASCVADLIEALFSRIETLRNEKSTTKQVKQRALVDLFKCLKEQGFSSMKWSIPSQIRESHQLLQLPIPNIGNVKSKATREALEKGESYFHRCQVEISRMRSEISMLGSQYMSQREMTLMQGYSDHILFLLCQERCMLAEMIETISEFGSFFDGYRCINDDIPLGQKQISHLVVSFEKSLALTIEGVWQLVLLLKETSYLVDNGEERDKIRDTITVLTGCAQTLEEAYSPSRGRVPISFDRLHNINVDVSRILDKSKRDLVSCVDACINILPSSIFDECINSMCESLNLALSITQPIDAFDTTCKVDTKATYTLKLISSLVQRTLISAQSVCMSREDETKSSSMDHPQSIDKDITVCDSHTKMINEWDGLQLSTLQNLLQDVSKSILSLHDNGVSNKLVLSLCTKTAINAFTLVQKVVHLYQLRLEDSSLFYCQHTKFLYVLLRVFRVLIAKGFCSDDVSDGGDGDGAGGMGEMKFEDDVEGTGMGEGEGKNDVTDQIENEEQLLGLKGEEQQEVGSSQEKKELNQDEVDTGMEMEGDFQGETYDIPEQQEDDNKDNDGDNEEEVDREMGDGYDPNEQVSNFYERV